MCWSTVVWLWLGLLVGLSWFSLILRSDLTGFCFALVILALDFCSHTLTGKLLEVVAVVARSLGRADFFGAFVLGSSPGGADRAATHEFCPLAIDLFELVAAFLK